MTIFKGYVITKDCRYFLQIPDPTSRWGFYLCDDDQSWDGGFGAASEWTAVKASEVPSEIRERLEWILEG